MEDEPVDLELQLELCDKLDELIFGDEVSSLDLAPFVNEANSSIVWNRIFFVSALMKKETFGQKYFLSKIDFEVDFIWFAAIKYIETSNEMFMDILKFYQTSNVIHFKEAATNLLQVLDDRGDFI